MPATTRRPATSWAPLKKTFREVKKEREREKERERDNAFFIRPRAASASAPLFLRPPRVVSSRLSPFNVTEKNEKRKPFSVCENFNKKISFFVFFTAATPSTPNSPSCSSPRPPRPRVLAPSQLLSRNIRAQEEYCRRLTSPAPLRRTRRLQR